MDVAPLKSILADGRPDSAIRLLAALGWNGDTAAIDRPPDAPTQYARLRMHSGTTAAGTQFTAEKNIWWTGFQQGALYHVAVQDGTVEWLDFETRKHWRATPDDDLRPLWGLSAEIFRKTGLFKPQTSSTPVADFLPKQAPRPYLTNLIRRWWWAFVGEEAAPKKADPLVAENLFVRLIARLVFIRTIEDTRRAEWMPWGTLRDIASDPQTVNSGLSALFKKLNTRLQSQVFTGPTLDLPKPAMTRELIGALYRSHDRELDFSAIDFHMIGRFYEQVVGVKLAVRETDQLTIWGSPEMEVVPDVSHRREHGQYYTPRAYADYLAQKAVLPRVLAASSVAELPVVADVAVGSGELLTAAFRQMLSVPRFRTPDAVREMLKSKFVGFDNHATAVHLSQLNLLRTAYLACPELVEHGLPLPSVGGLEKRDTLTEGVLHTRVVDVVVANPPFRGLPDWLQQLPPARKRVGHMRFVSGNSNRATAFLIRSAELVRPGGSIAIVLPNQFFVNTGNAKARAALAHDLAIEEIVVNHGAEVFAGVGVQPGILVARRQPRVRSPGMVLRILSPAKGVAKAIVRTGLPAAPGTHVRVVPAPIAGACDWIWDATAFSVERGGSLASAKAVIGRSFSRAPIPDRKPLKGVWSLESDGAGWKGTYGGLTKDAAAWILVPVQPKRLPRASPLIGSTAMKDLSARRVVFPYVREGDDVHTLSRAEWSGLSTEMGDLVQNVADAAGTRLAVKSKDYEKFRRSLETGSPQYFRRMGFRAGVSFVLFSRMAHVRDSSSGWPYWVFDEEAAVVPVDGLFVRVLSVVEGLALGALLNQEPVFEQLRRRAAATGPGSVEVSPHVASDLLIPDVRAARHAASWQRCLGAARELVAGGPEVDALLSALSATAASVWKGSS